MRRVGFLATIMLSLCLSGVPSAGGSAGDANRAVARLVEAGGVARLAILYRDDAQGRRDRNRLQAALARRAMGVVALAGHDGTDQGLRRALARLRPARPGGIILAGPVPRAAGIGRTVAAWRAPARLTRLAIGEGRPPARPAACP